MGLAVADVHEREHGLIGVQWETFEEGSFNIAIPRIESLIS